MIADLFSFAGFAVRNPAFVVKKARRAWATHKVMQKFRNEHPACAWCGRSKRLDVHHITPASVAPELVAEPSNMLMLCRKPQCHLQIGHNGNYGRRYVENVKQLCTDRNVIRTRKGTV